MTVQSRYYKIYDNVYVPGRWHLGLPVDRHGEWRDTWQFKEGKVLNIEGSFRFPVKPAGVALEYSLSMGVPVVHRRVVSLFERLGVEKEVQFIPSGVEGQAEP
jgi:hypothetical protein